LLTANAAGIAANKLTKSLLSIQQVKRKRKLERGKQKEQALITSCPFCLVFNSRSFDRLVSVNDCS
jgi:hypothetical protein